MKKLLTLSLAALAVVSASASVYAQNEENKKEKELQTIYITSQRTSTPVEEKVVAVSVITQDEILRSGAVGVAEVLRGRAGISIDDLFGDGSEATIDMRGFGGTAGSNVLVLVNGRRLNNPDIDSPNLNSISLKNVERIEIIKGSAGSLYGDQAVGGVVNIITRSIEGFSAEVTTFLGSYNRRGLSADFDQADDKNYVRIFLESIKSDGYRDNNQSDSQYFFSRVGHKLDKTDIYFEFQVDDDERKLPGALLSNEADNDRKQSLPDFQNDFSKTKEMLTRFGLEQEISSGWKFLSEFSKREQKTDFILNFRNCLSFGCNTTADQEQRKVTSFTPRVVGYVPVGEQNIQLTVGIDAEKTDYKIKTAFVGRSNDQDVNSGYFQAVVPLESAITVTLGARYSKVENRLTDNTAYPLGAYLDDSAMVNSFGVAKNFSNIRVFARYDENFRFAKVDELARSAASAQLENQLGVSKEIGVDFQFKSADIQLLAYQLDLENEIAYDSSADGIFGPGSGANINYKSTRRQGFSFDYEQQLHPLLNLNTNISYIEAEFTANGGFGSNIVKGSSISGVSEILGYLSLDYQVADGLNLFYEASYVGEQYLSGDNDNSDPKKKGYVVSNVASHYEIGNWEFNARINNIFNKEYNEFENSNGAVYPSPERNFQVNTTYHF